MHSDGSVSGVAGKWFVLDRGPSRIALDARKTPARLLRSKHDVCSQESKMTEAGYHLQRAHSLVE